MAKRYNNKIRFWKEGNKVQQPDGSYDSEIVTVLETWAKIEQLKVSKDIEQANQKLPKVFRVKIRFRESFEPKVDTFVEWNGANYVIISSPQIDETIRSREIVFDIK